MNPRMPISQIGGVALDREVSDIEWKLRIELAAAFRVAHHLGWNVDTLNHITLRIPGTNTFLMNPLGLGWDEITASSLASTDYDRNILSHSGIKLAPAGYNFHSGILRQRPDINCVMHTHEDAGTVISATVDGLLIFDQGGCRLHDEVGYHDFEGLAKEEDEVPRILHDLRQRHTLIMRNHGLLAVGASVGEAFGWMRALIDACALQERVLATGAKYRSVPAELQMRTKAQMSGNRVTNAPREDHSWQYWLRLADRLDPSFAT